VEFEMREMQYATGVSKKYLSNITNNVCNMSRVCLTRYSTSTALIQNDERFYEPLHELISYMY